MRRIALYCRVSTDNQEKAETIDNQLRDLYKVYNKADVVKVYKDNPGSGADPDRAGLWEMRKDAQKKMFDIVGLWSTYIVTDVSWFGKNLAVLMIKSCCYRKVIYAKIIDAESIEEYAM